MEIKVFGLEQALADLSKKEGKIIEAVKLKISDTATDIERQAIANAPVSYKIGDYVEDLKFIKQKINKQPSENGLLFKVGLSVPSRGKQWEAWIEFGTGLSAEQILGGAGYTPEIKAQARSFFRNGKGRIIGQPYLYPAFFKNTANLVEEIKKKINENLK